MKLRTYHLGIAIVLCGIITEGRPTGPNLSATDEHFDRTFKKFLEDIRTGRLKIQDVTANSDWLDEFLNWESIMSEDDLANAREFNRFMREEIGTEESKIQDFVENFDWLDENLNLMTSSSEEDLEDGSQYCSLSYSIEDPPRGVTVQAIPPTKPPRTTLAVVRTPPRLWGFNKPSQTKLPLFPHRRL